MALHIMCRDFEISCDFGVIWGDLGCLWAVEPPPKWAKRHIIARRFGLGLDKKYRKVMRGRQLRLIFRADLRKVWRGGKLQLPFRAQSLPPGALQAR